jgi:hypothetical protein
MTTELETGDGITIGAKDCAFIHRILSRNSSCVTPMSLIICRKRGAAMSRPEWKGTVVPLPSEWRNWRCAPRWRTSTKPRCSSARTTSRGLRTGRRGIGSNSNRLRADKFRFEAWISVLEQHGYNLAEILSQLVERRPLRVRSSPAWNIADKKTGIRIAFDNRCETPHE